MASLHSNRGAKRAREARVAFGLDPSAPLSCLLTVVEERAGVPVILRAMPEEIAGCLWHDGDRRLVHVNGVHRPARRRFTLAHELGHVRCAHEGALAIDDVVTISGGITLEPVEVQANAFAAEFLVPRSGLEQVVDAEPTLDELVVIAAMYGVSAIVALLRCVTCGLVGARRAERLRGEIDAGHHLERHAALSPPVVDDRLAAIAELPYLSPSLRSSALAAALGGSASIDRAAASAGISADALLPAVVALAERGPAAT